MGIKPKDIIMESKVKMNGIITDFDPEEELPDAPLEKDAKSAEKQLTDLAKVLHNNFLFAINLEKPMDMKMLRTMVGDVNHSMYLMVVMAIVNIKKLREQLSHYEKDRNFKMFS